MKKENGITLIALVITVIVLGILAGVAIGSISGDDGTIAQTEYSAFGTKIRDYQKVIQEYIVKKELTNYDNTDIIIKTYSKEEIKAIIPHMTDEDAEKYVIQNNELRYEPDRVTQEEKEWLEKLGIQESVSM